MVNRLAKIILIVLVLFILIFVSLNLLRGSTSTGISFLDSLLPWELEGEVDDGGIVNTFYNFIESYDECKQNNKSECFCSTSLELSPNYILNIDGENIKLIREENGLAIEKKDLTCILDVKANRLSVTKQGSFTIKFDKQEPYILREKWFVILDSKASFYSNYPILYKFNKDEICWVTEKVEEDYLKEIKQC